MKKALQVAVLIDALGWEIVEHFGFCRNLLPHASPLGTVLGYSSAAIPSLLTGELPQRHGAWAMYKLNSGESPFRFLRFLPALPHPIERRVRLLTKRMIDRRELVQGYYSLYDIPVNVLGNFDFAFKLDPYAPGSMPVRSIFDEFVSLEIPYRLWTYRTPEDGNMRELLTAVKEDGHFLFFYTAELDALMHRKGIFHPEVEQKLDLYEGFVGSILKTAKNAGRDAHVYLLSDHGMTDVSGTADVWGAVSRMGYRLGRDYMAFFDSTMARFWCDEDITGEITPLLEDNEWGRMLSDEELKTYGCYFEDGSFGKKIYLLSPGLMVVPSFMGKSRLAAMHGYDPSDRFSKGCIMTNDPECTLPDSILGIKSFLLDRIGRGIS